MKLSDYVISFLVSKGVKHCFMLPGGGAMHLNDSLAKSDSLAFICNLHEQAASIAAEAYAQCAGLGVVFVTTGPGGTNAITGVAGAWLESTPMIVISGQVKRPDLASGRGVRQIGFQEIDIVSVVSPITKYAVVVLEPTRIREHLEEAFWKATHGRKGPVWLDIPLDVQAAEIDPDGMPAFAEPLPALGLASRVKGAADETVTLLQSARRPIIIAGNGVRHSNSIGQFLDWARSLGIPILTTWKALDFVVEDDPLYVGRPGAVGQRAANFAQQSCDLLICLGARLDFGQTAYNHAHFAPHAKKVVVDIDPSEIEKLKMDIAVPLAADVGLFIANLLTASSSMRFPDWNGWTSKCRLLKQRFPLLLPEHKSSINGVNNYFFVDVVGRLLADGDVLVPGSSGACSEVTAQSVPIVRKIRFINTHGLGAMGFGVPAAIGACLASEMHRTICIDGDGGFVMNAQELVIASRLDLPIKYFVLNNGGYGSIRTTQINYFQSRFIGCDPKSGLEFPDLEKTADACRIPFRRISNQDDLESQVRQVLNSNGPVICEVMMAPDQFTQPKVSSKLLPDGRMMTVPMEDLWPFLERKEFDSIMAELLS